MGGRIMKKKTDGYLTKDDTRYKTKNPPDTRTAMKADILSIVLTHIGPDQEFTVADIMPFVYAMFPVYATGKQFVNDNNRALRHISRKLDSLSKDVPANIKKTKTVRGQKTIYQRVAKTVADRAKSTRGHRCPYCGKTIKLRLRQVNK